MKVSIEYLDDILIRMAYHSSAIEGNTITLPETVSIILEGTLPTKGKSIREFYEIENHKQTFIYMMELLESDEKINHTIIQTIHSLLTDRLQHDKGKYKTSQNAIRGAEFETASPEATPGLMQQWIDNTIYRLEEGKDEKEILTIIADTHISFERIHPFSDGNGRTGRMLLMYLSIQYLDIPVIIRKDNRGKYIEYLGEQDVESLANMLNESLSEEKNRILKFK